MTAALLSEPQARYSVARGEWKILRPSPTPPVSIECEAVHRIHTEIAGAPEDCLRFFATLFSADVRRDHQRKRLAWHLATNPSTLTSRFIRAGLPSPKRYGLAATYVRAARMLEDPRVTFNAVCAALELASSQTLHRTLRQQLGLTGRAFRLAYSGETMLAWFIDELIVPYRSTLLSFRPLTAHAPTPKFSYDRETRREVKAS